MGRAETEHSTRTRMRKDVEEENPSMFKKIHG